MTRPSGFRAQGSLCARSAAALLSLATAFAPSGASAQAQVLDPYVDVPADAPYGTRTVPVPAGAYWVNTGVYLRPGQSATIRASGTWRFDGWTSYGPNGQSFRTNPDNSCRVGQLVARISMELDTTFYCLGTTNRTITAPVGSELPEGGILYLAANTPWADALDWRDGRRHAAGQVTATVTSSADTVPTILTNQASSYDYSRVRSGWVELRTEHVILAVPTDLMEQDAGPWYGLLLLHFDAAYRSHAELRGATPYGGQRIRFAVSNKMFNAGAWMEAGNPIRMDRRYIELDEPDRITVFGDAWAIAHELGHDFNVIQDRTGYMVPGTWESWPNIFTNYFHEFAEIEPTQGCNATARDEYIRKGTYATFRSDAWLQYCFFMDIKEAYGWDAYRRFFQILNGWNTAIPSSSEAETWHWVRDRLNSAIEQTTPGADVTPIFESYRIPL